MKKPGYLLTILSGACIFVSSLLGDTPAERLTHSMDVLNEIMSAPDRGIPRELLAKANCVVVVPGVLKAAFIVGGKYGKGFMACRRDSNSGWSAPAAIRVEGGSFGFQIGGSETDAVMLVMDATGRNSLLRSKFTLGGDVSIAGGPVGRSSSAETDAQMRAKILSYSRSRGVFAGVALNGATLRTDLEANQQLYGKRLTSRQIVNSELKAPAAAAKFIATLNQLSQRESH